MAYTLIKRVGGKVKIRNWILENLPKHEIFVEPFGGSFAVGLSVNAKTIVYNDLDEHVYNLFKVLRENPDEFLYQLNLTPYSREELNNAYNIFKDKTNKPWLKLSEVERARLYVVHNRQSFSGKEDGSWCTSKKGENISRTWKNLPELVIKMADKLKDAYIENKDYIDIFNKWDSEKTLIYADPPYEGVEKRYYDANKIDGFDHEKLAQEIHKLKSQVVISYYDSEYIRSLYPDFKVIEKEVCKHMQTKEVKDKVTEILLIKNNQIEKENNALYS